MSTTWGPAGLGGRAGRGALILAAGLAAAACGGEREDSQPTTGSQVAVGQGPTSGAGGDGGASTGGGSTSSDGGAGQGGAGQGGAGQGGTGVGVTVGAGGGAPIVCEPGEGPVGGLAVTPIPLGTCVAPGGTSVDVASPEQEAGFFDRLVTLGSSRIAGGEESFSGPIWMDADGSNVDPVPFYPGGTGLAVLGDELAVLGDSLAVRRFGSSGQPVGDEVVVGDFAGGGQGIAAHRGGYLVAWFEDGDVVARRLDAALVPSEEPTTVVGSALDDSGSMAVRGDGERTAIVYAGDAASHWAVSMVVVGEAYGPRVDVACGDENIRVVDVEALDDGWAILTRSSESATSHLIRTDADGIAIAAFELVGAPLTWGLRRNGDALAVVADLETARPALRTFDVATFEPLGDWVCLAADSAGGWQAAVDVDGSGFAVLHASDTQGLRLTRTDATGEGP